MSAKEKKKENIFKRLLGRKKLLAVLLVVIVGLFWFIRSRNNEEVESTTIKKGDVVEELVLSGEVMADEHASLTFVSSGKISWVGVAEGDEVKKGQALTRLDITDFDMDLKIADATLRSKAATLDRVYDDVQDSEDDESYDEIESRTIAETNKDIAVFTHIKEQNDYANATLKSPFAGIVSYIAHPFPGANVLYTETQVEVVNPETIYFEVVADQTEVTQLHVGQSANMILDSFSDEEYKGEIVFISYTPKADEVGTAYKVKVEIKGEIDVTKLRIGMTGDAKFVTEEKKDVLYIPPKFINTDNSGKYVKLGRKNNKVYVEVGAEGEERIEISGEIKEDETVFD